MSTAAGVQVESRDRKSEVHDGARNRGWRGPLSAHQSRRIILWLLVFLGFAIRFIGSNSKLVSEWTSTLMEVNTPRTDLTERKSPFHSISLCGK